MFKNVLLVLSTLLTIVTVPVMAQCSNGACGAANAIYKECKYSSFTKEAFKKCLCTKKFLVNYDRCINGFVCPWDGNPATLNNPCIALYCPGTFDGGFDAKKFCALTPATTLPPATRVSIPPFETPIPIETGIA